MMNICNDTLCQYHSQFTLTISTFSANLPQLFFLQGVLTIPENHNSTRKTMQLEHLPTELKRLILRAAPDTLTLSALVHASPDLHAVYLDSREECFTQATIKELENADIELFEPLVRPDERVLGPDRWHPWSVMVPTVEVLQECYQQSQHRESMRLTIPHCQALRELRQLIQYYVRFGYQNNGETVYCFGEKSDYSRISKPDASYMVWIGKAEGSVTRLYCT